jgi:hypothetical protein
MQRLVQNTYKILVTQPEGKRPFGRFRYRLEYNIKTALKEIRWKEIEWIHMAQDKNHWWDPVNMVMNRGTVTISFSRRTLFHEVSQ